MSFYVWLFAAAFGGFVAGVLATLGAFYWSLSDPHQPTKPEEDLAY